MHAPLDPAAPDTVSQYEAAANGVVKVFVHAESALLITTNPVLPGQ